MFNIDKTPCCNAVGALYSCSTNRSSLQMPLLQCKMMIKVSTCMLASSHVSSMHYDPCVKLTVGQQTHNIHRVHVQQMYIYKV